MLRIAHRILNLRPAKDDHLFWPIYEAIATGTAHIVCCDNVAEYMASGIGETVDVSAIPGVVPPWQITLTEWTTAYEVHDVYGRRVQQQALFCVVCDLSGDEGQLSRERLSQILSTGNNPHDLALKNDMMRQCDDARWWIIMQPLGVSSGRLTISPFVVNVLVSNEGSIVDTVSVADKQTTADQLRTDDMQFLIHDMRCVAFTAISMMNCKNVKMIDSTAIDAPPAKWQRRMKTPEIRYSRIKIDGFTSEAKTQGGGIEGHNKAWHICRGNFATYTDAKPLFGKYTGRYWRPQHVRGDKKHGEVHSTHEVCMATKKGGGDVSARNSV